MRAISIAALASAIATTQSAWPADKDATVEQHGKASYYSDRFAGRKTASGVTMNQGAMTAASPNLPLGAKAKVTDTRTGKTVDVKVNDRGPYKKGRIIDVSKRAAKELDIKEDGVAPVRVEAKPSDQPTPELKAEVAQVAKEAKRNGGAEHPLKH
ncbi:MAG: septal ring lytic transglycosylase RlpA family lipoprotein [Rhodospirillales bacterium]|nr:septal ring lytic transglycosylase RlpA family lipoprotein [Rhodospirillales bacterium]